MPDTRRKILILLTTVNKIDLINYDKEDSKKHKTGDMRFGVNKRKFDPQNFIMNFLDEYEPSSLNEIFKELVRIESTYSKPAIQKILKKMEKEKIIRNISLQTTHPRYSIIDTTDFKIKKDAYFFKYNLGAFSLGGNPNTEELDKIKRYDNPRQDAISKLIFNYGIISLYTLLASYRRSISPKHDKETNQDTHKLWLRNALAFEVNLPDAKFSECLKKELKQNIRQTNPTSEYTVQELIAESRKIERVLSKMFPSWSKQYHDDEDRIDKPTAAGLFVLKTVREALIMQPELLLS